jgi:hypothetical protein
MEAGDSGDSESVAGCPSALGELARAAKNAAAVTKIRGFTLVSDASTFSQSAWLVMEILLFSRREPRLCARETGRETPIQQDRGRAGLRVPKRRPDRDRYRIA